MIHKIMTLSALIAIPVFVPISKAQAADYCREYTKTVSVGGRAERAYGTACYRPDGSWEIISLKGENHAREKVRDVIYDDIERYASRRGYRDVNRVVVRETYRHAPRYYNHRYQRHSKVYSGWPHTLSFNFGDYHDRHHHKKYKKVKHKKKHYYKHR